MQPHPDPNYQHLNQLYQQQQQQPYVVYQAVPYPVYYTSDPAAYSYSAYPVQPPPPPPAPAQYWQQPPPPQQFYPAPPPHSVYHPYIPPPAPTLGQVPSPAPSPVLDSTSTSSSRPASSGARPTSSSSSSALDRRRDSRSASPFTPLQLSHQRQHARLSPGYSADMSDYANQLVEAERDLAFMKLDWLKATIRKFNTNDTLAVSLRLSGNKSQLHQSLVNQLRAWFGIADKLKFTVAKNIIRDLRNTTNLSSPAASAYSSAYGAGAYSSPTTGYGAAANGYGSNAYASTSTGAGAGAYRAGGASTSTGAGLPPPRFGAYNAATGASTSAAGAAAGRAAGAGAGGWQAQRLEAIPITFRASPFYRVDKGLSGIVTMVKAGQGDKKTATCAFALTEAQRTLLSKARESPANPQYQVRLYCTSDTNWNTARATSNQFPAPIEFPMTAEVKLNSLIVSANTKGIKKQPGTAPPVNLSAVKGPSVNLAAGATNRVEVAYASTDKVYYMVVYLVEYTSIDKVVNRVKVGKTRSREEVIEHIVALNSDEEIEATALELSLRDPLSFSRIDTPIRSVHCNHIACFDAATWFEMNEQTPQWGCPICSKVLKVDDMIVDGYLEDILKICNSEVDTVSVEPDGTWRSDDNKHGTAKPRPTPSASASAAPSGRGTPAVGEAGAGLKAESREGTAVASGSGAGAGGGGAGGGGAGAVLTLDSDDDSIDEPLAKRPRLAGSFGGAATPSSVGGSVQPGGGNGPNGAGGAAGGGAAGGGKKGEVLDLTLSSDDDSDGDDDDEQPVRAPPARPSLTMARVGSSGRSEQKTADEVQQDIDAMHKRMTEAYGPNWREEFARPV